VKKKSYLITALLLALLVSSGLYASTFTTAASTIPIAQPPGNVVSSNATAIQPDWDSILDDLASENKTCGEIPAGDLFTISPDTTYGGDMIAKVYLTNTGNLTKAFSYLNMKLYLAGSVEAGETPNYRLITLQNGEAALTLEDLKPVSGSWIETTQAEFADSTLNQVDVNTSPGDVILDKYSDNVTDTYDNTDNIASSANVTVADGQAKLEYTSGTPATETLRPDGTGDETGIVSQEPIGGEHWDKVDDSPSHDGDSTYVYTDWYLWQEDLYTMADHSTGGGVINYVRVYAVAKAYKPKDPNLYIHIKTNGVEHNGPLPENAYATTDTWATYSYQWNDNPETGNPWTWGEIDALQIGVGISRPAPPGETYVTQVYAEINYTAITEHATGTLTSTNLVSGETVKSIDSFDYIASAIPSGTSLKVQFSQDGTNWYNSAGTPGGWDTLSQGTNNIDLSGLGWSGPNFYYHMLFTSDGSDTPILDEIKVNFSTYYVSGDLISSSHDNGYDLDWNWGTISFTIVEPSATDIQFQIRTAATEGGLSSATWTGPTGTGDYYTTGGTAINSVHDGDRWIQYKAYFSGPGTSTPTFSEISIT